jgi:hypothetical protein
MFAEPCSVRHAPKTVKIELLLCLTKLFRQPASLVRIRNLTVESILDGASPLHRNFASKTAIYPYAASTHLVMHLMHCSFDRQFICTNMQTTASSPHVCKTGQLRVARNHVQWGRLILAVLLWSASCSKLAINQLELSYSVPLIGHMADERLNSL